MNKFVFAVALSLVLLVSTTNIVLGISSQDSKTILLDEAKKHATGDWNGIETWIDANIKNWTLIQKYDIGYKANSTELNDFHIAVNESWIPVMVNGSIVNGTQLPPPKPIEVCGDGIDNNGDGQIDEGCPTVPPEPKDNLTTAVNTTKTLRVGAFGDIDLNTGLDDQIALFKKYNVDTVLVLGDYGYKDCQKVLDKLRAADFNHVLVLEGNHDCSDKTNNFNGWTQTYGNFTVGKLSVFSIDGNIAMDCGSAQFKSLKPIIQSSNSMYKFVGIHQPFVTAPNDHHGPNGQFDCWNPLFMGAGITAVLQAHVHNYQRFDINGMPYQVDGTGTHDQGSNMYKFKGANDWQGFHCIKCFTGTNGVTLLDLQIDKPNVHHVNGWFIDMNEKVKDKYVW